MERRSSLSEVPESCPLIDARKLRSCRSSSASSRSTCTDTRTAPWKTGTASTLNRSASAPHPGHPSNPNHVRSPQYRVNPMVKFSDRPVPERMNYGIAGYNTARPRSFSSVPDSASRPRSFSRVPEMKTRPRSFSSVPESTSRALRSVFWRSWTRRFRDKMGRVRVRESCSKLLSRFRSGHL